MNTQMSNYLMREHVFIAPSFSGRRLTGNDMEGSYIHTL